MKFLLRVEAVNLDHYVYDTEDLSTIRGSGIQLLGWPDLLESKLQEVTERESFQFLSRGASAALLQFEDGDPDAVRSTVENFLRTHQELKYATFVVDAVVLTGPFFDHLQELLLLNRIRQLRQIDVPVAARNDEPNSRRCSIDQIRPGTKLVDKTDEAKRRVCASVATRHNLGRDAKRRLNLLYRQDATTFLDPENPFIGTWDFKQLTKRRGAEESTANDKLHQKIALIYVDGNKFGQVERSAARKGARKLMQWDRFLRDKRAEIGKALLKCIQGDPAWMVPAEVADKKAAKKYFDVENLEYCHQFETLLWGGDEHIWVVPAWQGWWTVNFFFDQAGRWGKFDGERLSHSAGVVFCHHNAPIRNVVMLARKLAEAAKHVRASQLLAAGDKEPPSQDAIAYQVLESFDHLGEDYERIRALRRPRDANEADMILTPEQWQDLCKNRNKLRGDGEQAGLPSGRIHQLAEVILQSDRIAYERILDRIAKVMDREQRLLSEWSKPQPTEFSKWMHLIELWDYLPATGTADAASNEDENELEQPIAMEPS